MKKLNIDLYVNSLKHLFILFLQSQTWFGAKDIIILICKRWGHVWLHVLICRGTSVWIWKADTSCQSHLSPHFPFFILPPFLIYDSMSVVLPDLDSFFLNPPHHHALSAWSASQTPQQSSFNSAFICRLPSPASSHPPFIPLVSLFLHSPKPQLMMNETSLPWAQTWVALWDGGQLPKGSSGLIPYSWAASTPVLLVLCIPGDPSLWWHPTFKVNAFFSPLTAISSLFLKQHFSFLHHMTLLDEWAISVEFIPPYFFPPKPIKGSDTFLPAFLDGLLWWRLLLLNV